MRLGFIFVLLVACSGSDALDVGDEPDGGAPRDTPAPSPNNTEAPTPDAGTLPAPVSAPEGNLPSPLSGKATYYAATGGGSCSFPVSPQDLDVAAISSASYAKAGYCGACAEVKGPKGTVTVRIVDKCPGCSAGSLDLSESAFAKIADVRQGVVPIEWKVVRCSSTAPVQYHQKDGASKFWTAIQVRNHRVPIRKVEFQKDGAFVEAVRQDYNYFVLSGGVRTDGAFKIRVTGQTGEVIEDTIPKPGSNLITTGTKNFQ